MKKMAQGMILAAIFLSLATAAQQYIPVEPNQTVKLEGTIKIGDEAKTITQIITVRDACQTKDSDEKLTVHEMKIITDGKEQTKVRWFSIRPDGIYVVAESDKMKDSPPKSTSYMYLPIPAENGKTWESSIQEDKKKLELKSTILSTDEKLTLNGMEYTTVHVKAEGTAKILGMQIPITRESWIDPKFGVVKQISVQIIQQIKTQIEISLSPTGN